MKEELLRIGDRVTVRSEAVEFPTVADYRGATGTIAYVAQEANDPKDYYVALDVAVTTGPDARPWEAGTFTGAWFDFDELAPA